MTTANLTTRPSSERENHGLRPIDLRPIRYENLHPLLSFGAWLVVAEIVLWPEGSARRWLLRGVRVLGAVVLVTVVALAAVELIALPVGAACAVVRDVGAPIAALPTALQWLLVVTLPLLLLVGLVVVVRLRAALGPYVRMLRPAPGRVTRVGTWRRGS